MTNKDKFTTTNFSVSINPFIVYLHYEQLINKSHTLLSSTRTQLAIIVDFSYYKYLLLQLPHHEKEYL